ncbi:hypothetical protein GCM10023094_56530 [Rhodococcus olei]|uniref:FAS1-like dehydratase domain-containing protein n=1 Tax=Rhodococcus olei TaxID=2161675 RepID=A0ABP8PV08_9NOCA
MTTSLLADDAHTWVGRTQSYQPITVTEADIARYALAIGATDPVYFDGAEARRAGHPAILAPRGFYMVLRFHAENLVALTNLGVDGTPPPFAPPNEATRRMAGASTVSFRGDIYAGQVITLSSTITAIEEKSGRSGPLVIVSYQNDFVDQESTLLVRETYVRLLR